MILLHWYSETKCEEWFGRVGLRRFLFCLLIVLCFSKWWFTKMDCAKNGEVFQTAKWLQSITQESFQVSHLKDCISTQNLQHTRFPNLKRCRQCSHLSRNMGHEEENRRALLLGWEDESVLSSKANPGCILSETGCAQICCVFGFHYSSLQTHPQLTANTVPHPWCSSTVWLPPVLSAQEP